MAHSATPLLLPFQARITDSQGSPIADGPALVRFQIFGTASDALPVWNGEIHRTTGNGGLINVVLGTKASFEAVDFGSTLYLEITPDLNRDEAITAADAPLLPRQVILPAPFAVESADSRKLAGHDWTALLGPSGTNPATANIPGARLETGSVQGSKLAAGAVRESALADESVSWRKRSPRSINESGAAGSVAVSPSTGRAEWLSPTPTQPTLVPNLEVTLTTSGGPVHALLTHGDPDVLSFLTMWNDSADGGVILELLRDDQPVGRLFHIDYNRTPGYILAPPSAFSWTDAPLADSHNYKVRAYYPGTATRIGFTNVRLMVYEL